MTVTLAFDSTLGRVRIDANGLSPATTVAVERSTDLVRWTTVRGASYQTVTAGVMDIPAYDYEYPNTGQPVTYRVRGLNLTPASFVAVGTGSAGADGSRTPGMPAGIVAGDVLLLLASTRNSGTGVPDLPAGWTHLDGSANVRLMGRVWDGVFTAPTVTFTGGATNETTLAQIAAFRDVDLSPASGNSQLNATPAQDIAFPGQGVLSQAGMLVVFYGWKQTSWTSVDNITDGYTLEISELSSTLGSDAGQVWDYYLPATTAAINPDVFTVNGGTTAISRGGTVALQHTESTVLQTAAITPDVGAVWLKSIARPFLNRRVDVRFSSSIDVTRRARAAIYPIIGRSAPVAVSTLRASREWTMLVRTETAQDRDNMDLLLASGDVLFIQSPPGSGVEQGYVHVADVTRSAHPLRPLSNLYTLPMTEVAAPSAYVSGFTSSWQTVLNAYASWADLIADKANWAGLLELVGDPTEVLVP